MATTTTPGSIPTTARTRGDVEPISFDALVRVELAKCTDTRSSKWLIGLSLAAAVIAVGVGVALPGSVDQNPHDLGEIAAYVMSVLLPIAAIMLLTTEWSQRTMLVTFTQQPRRLRVFGAKLAAGLWLGVGAVVVARVLAYAGVAVGAALGHDVGWAATGTLGMVGFILLNVLMALALGALLQNTAAAITLFFALPTVLSLVTTGPGALHDVGRWLDASQSFSWVLDQDLGGHVGPLLTSSAVWIVAPLAIGAWRMMRREAR